MGGPLNNADRSPDADDHRVLQVTGLSRQLLLSVHRQTVFDDLYLTAGRGEVVAILGASGSGKTALLNLISGIDTRTPAVSASTASTSMPSVSRGVRCCAVATSVSCSQFST